MRAQLRLNRLSKGELGALLPYPGDDANKYSRGFLEIVGGSADYPGAASLAADAALRMGAGYVEVACSPEAVGLVRTRNVDAVVRSWSGWACAGTRLAQVDADRPCACLIGSGMVADDAMTEELLLDVLEGCEHPVAIDGGALSALASSGCADAARARHRRGLVTVLTPHFGEASKLAAPLSFNVPAAYGADALADAAFALELACAYGSTVALKGPYTMIASPVERAAAGKPASKREVALMGWGTPALAKAGTGDVLAGMVAALLAQGLPAVDAVALGCGVHASAARFAGDELTDIGVRAQDLSRFFPDAIRSFESAVQA